MHERVCVFVVVVVVVVVAVIMQMCVCYNTHTQPKMCLYVYLFCLSKYMSYLPTIFHFYSQMLVICTIGEEKEERRTSAPVPGTQQQANRSATRNANKETSVIISRVETQATGSQQATTSAIANACLCRLGDK